VVTNPISVGIVPAKEFFSSIKEDIAVRLAISVGTVPVKEFLPRCNPFKAVRAAISVGIVPIRYVPFVAQ
jgi:hypothetical protein